MNKKIEEFILSCDEFISCKFLVAEYKLQKMLKALAEAKEVCELVGECLEPFNRDREFAKAYSECQNGDFVCVMPEEEYKIIALVFCTLVDIDNKKIDFTDFVMRFFGREENPYEAFINTMIVPFRNLIADVFCINNDEEFFDEEKEENEELKDEEECDECADKFIIAQKIAVQILSELQFVRQDYCVENVSRIARAIVKTAELKDEDVSGALISSLRLYKIKAIKFMVKELLETFGL